jgi:hypothetical protein
MPHYKFYDSQPVAAEITGDPVYCTSTDPTVSLSTTAYFECDAADFAEAAQLYYEQTGLLLTMPQ